MPDSITNAIVRGRLTQPDAAGGFLLDGYPRTFAQAGELDTILAVDNRRLDAVLELVVDLDAIVERMLRRAAVEGRPTTPNPSSGAAWRSTPRRPRP